MPCNVMGLDRIALDCVGVGVGFGVLGLAWLDVILFGFSARLSSAISIVKSERAAVNQFATEIFQLVLRVSCRYMRSIRTWEPASSIDSHSWLIKNANNLLFANWKEFTGPRYRYKHTRTHRDKQAQVRVKLLIWMRERAAEREREWQSAILVLSELHKWLHWAKQLRSSWSGFVK